MLRLNRLVIKAVFAFVVYIIFVLHVSTEVRADQDFEVGFDCDAGYSLITEEPPLFPIESNSATYISNNYPDICVRNNNEVLEIAGDNLHYCDASHEVGINGDQPRQGQVTNDEDDGPDSIAGECCPDGYPYFYYDSAPPGPAGTASLCCRESGYSFASGTLSYSGLQERCGPSGSRYNAAEPEQPDLEDIPSSRNVAIDAGGRFKWAEEKFQCGGCLIESSGKSIPNSTLLDTTSGYRCLSLRQSAPDHPDNTPPTNAFCGAGGELVGEDDPILTADDLEQCEKLALSEDQAVINSHPEVIACKKCIDRNTEDPNNIQNFVYTSIGCVDTSRDGLITRVFQIGIGVIGGFGVLQIIRAGYIMQKRDPSSVQEAREMVLSVVYAIFMLVGAIVILRFVGVNVLGLLPGGFFS